MALSRLMIRIMFILWQVSIAVTCFFVYGFMEAVASRGHVVAILLGVYLVQNYRYYLISGLLLTAYVAGFYLQLKEVAFSAFLAMLMNTMIMQYRQPTDTIVNFRPCEEEIRQLLFDKDPNKLSKVDAMLLKYKGREKTLLNLLHSRYHE